MYLATSYVRSTSATMHLIIPESMNRLCLGFTYSIRLGQPHMNISPGRHHLVPYRSLLAHTRRRRNERDVVIASEEERDRVSVLGRRWPGTMAGRDEDVVGPASELVADVDDKGVGDADGVDPWYGERHEGDRTRHQAETTPATHILLHGSAPAERAHRPVGGW